MWGKVNKLGGGTPEFENPITASFPFTATESGMAVITLGPSTSAASFYYFSAYDANNSKLYETGISSTSGMKNAIAIPLIKGTKYQGINASSNAVITIKLIYFK